MGTYSILSQAPQTSFKAETGTTGTPAWMQAAIYDQIQNAIATADRPYVPYALPTVAGLNPNQTQAYSQVQQNSTGFNAPTGMNAGLTNAATAMKAYQNSNTATGLSTGQTSYLSPNTPTTWLGNAGTNWASAVGANPATAGTGNLASSATSAGNITTNADPYLTSAGKTAYSDVGNYMNPYQQNVMDTLAQQAGRNLSENLLPQVSDQFIKAGQFGGNRMGEFGARALRDTQQTLLQEQGKLANQGYTQALTANQTDLARQATLGQTAGNLASQQAQAYQNVGQTQGQLTAQQQQNLATIANQQAQQAGQQQLAFGTGLFGQGANLLGQYQAGQVNALNPFTTYMGGVGTLEDLGQQPFNLGVNLGGRVANPTGAQALLQGGQNAALTMQQANAANPLAAFYQGAGKSIMPTTGFGNVVSGVRSLFGGENPSPYSAPIEDRSTYTSAAANPYNWAY
jgi:hypothetical protein